MIQTEFQDTIAIVKLDRGVTNAINLELVHDLAEAIQKVKANADAQGLVLGSTSEKFFSIGFDIPQLYDPPQEEMQVFYDSFNRMCLELYTLPKPTVAVLTGHTIAGGCILANCCDYRLMAEGRIWMGLNEIKLGVPVPHLADCILHSLVGTRTARDIMESGEFYSPGDAFQMGLVDDVYPRNEMMAKAMAKVQGLGVMPSKAFYAIKKNRTAVIEREAREKWIEKEQEFIMCWYSKEARGLLKAAMEIF
jgi:enoyl-CoA hydratase/carnithine racemase